MEGKVAVAGTQEEQELGWVEVQDLSRMREERFAERKEAAVQKR